MTLILCLQEALCASPPGYSVCKHDGFLERFEAFLRDVFLTGVTKDDLFYCVHSHLNRQQLSASRTQQCELTVFAQTVMPQRDNEE